MGGQPEPEHTLVKHELDQVVARCMPTEHEHLTSTLHEKIWNYLWKAKKTLNFDAATGTGSTQPWKDLVNDFSQKFYASLWTLGGDRKWIEEVDFTHLVGVAVQSYFPANLNVEIDPITFADSLAAIPEAAHDYNRFHYAAPEIVKKHVSSKAKGKIVYRAVDEGREETVNLGMLDALTFVRSWTQNTAKRLAAEGHPAQNLTKEQAVAMFDEFVCGVGVPISIMKMVDEKPQPGNQVVIDAVEEAYQAYGPPPRPKPAWGSGKGGGGYGAAQGGGYGAAQGGWGGQDGGSSGGQEAAMALLQGLAGLAQGKGGGGGGGVGAAQGAGAMLAGALMQMMQGGGSGGRTGPY